MTQARPRIALFVTCLVDLYRPNVGFAAIKLLEEAGCLVEVPPSQTCCGQPAYNSGDRANARITTQRYLMMTRIIAVNLKRLPRARMNWFPS